MASKLSRDPEVLMERAEELLKDMHCMNVKYSKAIWDILEEAKEMMKKEKDHEST